MAIDRKRLRKWLIGEFSVRRLVRSLLEVYICLLLWAFFFSDSLIFRPPQSRSGVSTDIYRIPVTEDEQIGMVEKISDDSRYVVLYAHGNAEDLRTVRFMAEEFRDHGLTAYAFDYRGYASSDGKASTRNALEDAEAAFLHLVGEKGIDESRIILHGRSLGAAMALDLASKHDIAGVVVESGFVTVFRARTQIPLSPFDKLRNNRRIREVTCPVLVIHGEEDRVIPFWQGQKLYELAPEPKWAYWAPGAGHNNVRARDEDEYWRRIRLFVGEIEKIQQPEKGS